MDKNLDQIVSMPFHQLKEYVHGLHPPVPAKVVQALASDHRKAVRRLAGLIRSREQQELREQKRLQALLRYEKELYAGGYSLIAGVDEAGVAPLAGPVVAAAVVLPPGYTLNGLNDSKKIPTMKKREILADRIKQDAVCWASGFAEVEEIDRLNVYRCSLLAMARAVAALPEKPEYILVDARTIPHCGIPQKAIVHGDALSASIAAASLIAKTTRDRYMLEMDRVYSGYGFAAHKGYPTPDHLRVLERLGPLPIHRKSFAPVREALQMDPVQRQLFAASRPDPESGHT